MPRNTRWRWLTHQTRYSLTWRFALRAGALLPTAHFGNLVLSSFTVRFPVLVLTCSLARFISRCYLCCGSLTLFGTLHKPGSLADLGTFIYVGSLCCHSTLVKDGSLPYPGTIHNVGSLPDHGTFSLCGSLCYHDALCAYGSLSEHGTLKYVGSLLPCGTLTRFGYNPAEQYSEHVHLLG